MNYKITKIQSFLRQSEKIRKEGQIFAFYHLPFALISLWFISTAHAQDLPDEIRGYKVHKTKISVTNNKTDNKNENEKSEAVARLTDPELIDAALTGLTFEISAEIEPVEYKGKIDFLMFKDFRVNGLAVEIEEYRNPFELRKNEVIKLPQPVKIFLGAKQVLQSAVNEATNSKDEWTVTGRVFVFGHFKKWGFEVKRVVPVDVNVKIKNPVKKGDILSKINIPSF